VRRSPISSGRTWLEVFDGAGAREVKREELGTVRVAVAEGIEL